MNIIQYLPLGVYGVLSEGSQVPAYLCFLYVRGTSATVDNILSIMRAPDGYLSKCALNIARVCASVSIKQLLCIKLKITSAQEYIFILSSLGLEQSDVYYIPISSYATILRGVTHKSQTFQNAKGYFYDCVHWFKGSAVLTEPFEVASGCILDIAPTQFKTLYINGTPVCYWNTSLSINESLRTKAVLSNNGLVIDALSVKQALTLELTRHKFINVGEKLVIDFKSGACMRFVGTVNRDKTSYTGYSSVFDPSRNLWIPQQETIEKQKILGIRSR